MIGCYEAKEQRTLVLGCRLREEKKVYQPLPRLVSFLLFALLSVVCLQAQLVTRSAIGHNRLALSPTLSENYGDLNIPQMVFMLPGSNALCYLPCWFMIPTFPYNGIIIWINDDSGWQPEGWIQLQFPDGNGGIRPTVNIEGRPYRVYWRPYQVENPSARFVLVPYPNRSVWEQQSIVERDLIIYIDEYGYYWQLCNYNARLQSGLNCRTCCSSTEDCWVPREGWDGTPDFAGNFGPPHLCGWFYFPPSWQEGCPSQGLWQWQCSSRHPLGRGAQLLFRGKVTSVPLCCEDAQSADAAVDSRPVCPDPEKPPTYAQFGKYTFLGGLFTGQVPFWYGNSRVEGQTSSDLSGTGRTLLRFYHPNGFPAQVDAACLSLVYTATPNSVADSFPQAKAIGVKPLPSTEWVESEVSWKLLEQLNLHMPFTEQNHGWLGSTRDLIETIRPRDDHDPVDMSGNLTMHAERTWSSTTIKRVVVPLTSLNPIGQQRQFASLLLALYTEEPIGQRSPSNPTWYYFLGKEHPMTTPRTCPRLWYVVRQQ